MTETGTPSNRPSGQPDMPLSREQREEFLRAQGWRPDMDPAARIELENYWTDADIRMAQGLNQS